jgi:4-amino-4-deoxy-L-arabinose transferase-like glycosyltransferase
MEPGDDGQAEGSDGPRFLALLALIIAVGAVLRIVYDLRVAVSTFPDTNWYMIQAMNLRTGLGYIDPAREFAAFHGHPQDAGFVATAYWPPLYAGFLAGVQSVFGDANRTAQLSGVATGCVTILMTGLLGREIAGRRVALVGAAIVACSPYLIAVDGSRMTETLYVPLVLLALFFAQRARNHPTVWAWSLLGASIGFAALTRGDALALIPFVMIPAAFLSRDTARHLLPRVACGAVVLALVLAPWVIRNAVKVGEPTISTVSASGVIAGANCPRTYSGRALGYWVYACMHPERGSKMKETEYTAQIRREGANYAFDHVSRWPIVTAARFARVWGLWDPRDLTQRESLESRSLRWQQLSWGVSLLTLVLALVGFWALAKQRRQIAVLVGPVLMTAFIAVTVYGNTRFRAATEPVLAIAAAAAIVFIVDQLRGSPAVPPVESTEPELQLTP